jgi:hypothetical protein
MGCGGWRHEVVPGRCLSKALGRVYLLAVTGAVDDQQDRDEPLLDWDAARFLFWPILALSILSAVGWVTTGALPLFGLGSLLCFQSAWGLLKMSGRLKGRKTAERIGSWILRLSWIAVVVAYAVSRGWLSS